MNFILGAIAGMFILKVLQYTFEDKCPRQIYGYKCKGKECDHSEAAVAEAKWEMNRK